jgi:saccharopine dehydrogenase (NADP+, L-glutamate forming)
LSKAQKLAAKFLTTRAIALDVADSTSLYHHVAEHDVVISLIPYTYHPAVIKAAIAGRTHVVTTSYISDAMRSLDNDAQRVGITVLNEFGVDPGIDHLYAIRKINEVHAQGGKVLEFHSYCGGLPAPEFAGNPLGFKFSWSPRGALLSQLNSMRYLENGRIVHIPSKDLMDTAVPYHVKDGYDFVTYANRDSVPFREFYNIPEAQTVIRGSLCYKGNPSFVMVLANMGWLEQDKKEWLDDGMTWADIQQKVVGALATDEK